MLSCTTLFVVGLVASLGGTQYCQAQAADPFTFSKLSEEFAWLGKGGYVGPIWYFPPNVPISLMALHNHWTIR